MAEAVKILILTVSIKRKEPHLWLCLKLQISKIYSTRFGGNKVQALSNVTFSVEEGEFVAIMGESGSGKTTLLNILASLDRPTSGEVLLEGKISYTLQKKKYQHSEGKILDLFSGF